MPLGKKLWSCGFAFGLGFASRMNQAQRRTFVNSNMAGFIALDHVLRLVLGSVPHVAFEPGLRREFLMITPPTRPTSEFQRT